MKGDARALAWFLLCLFKRLLFFFVSLQERRQGERQSEKLSKKERTTLTIEGMEATALDWRLPFLLLLFIVLLSLSRKNRERRRREAETKKEAQRTRMRGRGGREGAHTESKECVSPRRGAGFSRKFTFQPFRRGEAPNKTTKNIKQRPYCHKPCSS